jgi:hypothetical protein
MKLTNRLATIFATIALIAPLTSNAAETIADELMDSTHDMRAQVELKQEIIPNWEAPVSDSWAVINGGSPFTQGGVPAVTIDDASPGLDIGSASNTAVMSLEDLSQ